MGATPWQLLADLVGVFEELSGQMFGLSREAIQAQADTAAVYALGMGAFQRSGVLLSQGDPAATDPLAAGKRSWRR